MTTILIRCVIYLRFSSSMQRQESADSQLRLCREHAARKGYVIVGVYQDAAMTGTNDRRDAFQEMIELLLSGRLEADIVLCWKFDRLWRDTDAPGYYKYQLRQVGVRVESVSLQIDRTSPYSVFLEGIDQAQAAHYSVNLAIETTRGQVQNALACRSSGGRPVLGYRLIEDETQPEALRKKIIYILDERGAAAVRHLFTRYAAGARVTEIVDELNAAGYRTARGRPFHLTSIHELLHNEKYIGVYEYRAWRRENAQKRSTGHMYEAEEQIIRIEDGIPAIVDRATWDVVQARLQARKHGRSLTGTVIYLLSGVVYCGSCGAPMHGDRRVKRTAAGEQTYHYYACSRRGAADCRQHAVVKDWIEVEVLRVIEDRLFSADGQVALATELLRWRADYAAHRQDAAGQLRKQLRQIEQELTHLIDGITQGVPVTPMISERIASLETERAGIAAQLEDLPTAPAPVSEDLLRRRIAALREKLHTADDRARQTVLGELVESVVIHPDRVDITLAMTPTTANGGGIIPRRTRSVGKRSARDWNKKYPALREGVRITVSVRRTIKRRVYHLVK